MMSAVRRYKELAQTCAEDWSRELISVSHDIHACPEVAFQEYRAARRVAETLASHGFTARRGRYGLPTAVDATFGSGDLVIAVCAEYDALPEIGHACGHNIIAAAAVGAGLALARVADDIGVTVKILGTPAEESGGGKILMLERGAFDGVHAVMAIHPGPFDSDYVPCRPVACAELMVTFLGENGQRRVNKIAESAIMALEDLDPADRIGYVPVAQEPSRSTARCSLESMTLGSLLELERRVSTCLEAVASATQNSVSVVREEPPYSHFASDEELESCYAANLRALGRTPGPHDDDVRYSTDLANVSLVVPTISPCVGIESGTSVNHDADFTAYCVGPSADAAVLRGAAAMAWTAIDAATNDLIRARLRARP